MLELPHTVTGALIASKIPNPFISIPIAFLSHFLLDLVPHWNPDLIEETERNGKPTRKSTLIVIIDLILSLLAGFFIASRFWPNLNRVFYILIACLAAVIIDVVEGFYFFLGARNKFLRSLINFQVHYQAKTGIIQGILSQAIVLIIAFYLTLST